MAITPKITARAREIITGAKAADDFNAYVRSEIEATPKNLIGSAKKKTVQKANFKKELKEELVGAALDTELEFEDARQVIACSGIWEMMVEHLARGIHGNLDLTGREKEIFNEIVYIPIELISMGVDNDFVREKVIADLLLYGASGQGLVQDQEALLKGSAEAVKAAADAAAEAARKSKNAPLLVVNESVQTELLSQMIEVGENPLTDGHVALLENKENQKLLMAALFASCENPAAKSLCENKDIIAANKAVVDDILRLGTAELDEWVESWLQKPSILAKVVERVTPDDKYLLENKNVSDLLVDQMLRVTEPQLSERLANLLNANDALISAAINAAANNLPAKALLAHEKLRETLLARMVARNLSENPLQAMEIAFLEAKENDEFLAAAAAAALAHPPASALVAYSAVQAKLIAGMLVVSGDDLGEGQSALLEAKENADLRTAAVVAAFRNPSASALRGNEIVKPQFEMINQAVAEMVEAGSTPLNEEHSKLLGELASKALIMAAADAATATTTAMVAHANVEAELVRRMVVAAGNPLPGNSGDLLAANPNLVAAAADAATAATTAMVAHANVKAELVRRMVVAAGNPLPGNSGDLLAANPNLVAAAADAATAATTAMVAHANVEAELVRRMVAARNGELPANAAPLLGVAANVNLVAAAAAAATAETTSLVANAQVEAKLVADMVAARNGELPANAALLLGVAANAHLVAAAAAAATAETTSLVANAQVEAKLVADMVAARNGELPANAALLLGVAANANAHLVAAAADAATAETTSLVANAQVEAKLVADMVAARDGELPANAAPLLGVAANANLVAAAVAAATANPAAKSLVADPNVLGPIIAAMVARGNGGLTEEQTLLLRSGNSVLTAAATVAIAAAVALDPAAAASLAQEVRLAGQIQTLTQLGKSLGAKEVTLNPDGRSARAHYGFGPVDVPLTETPNSAAEQLTAAKRRSKNE